MWGRCAAVCAVAAAANAAWCTEIRPVRSRELVPPHALLAPTSVYSPSCMLSHRTYARISSFLRFFGQFFTLLCAKTTLTALFAAAYEKSDNAKLRCDCLINRGAVHKKLRDFAAAQDDYELALELGRKEKLSKDTLSTLHMNRGQLFDKVTTISVISEKISSFVSAQMLLPQKAVEEYSNYIALKGQLINIARNNRGLALGLEVAAAVYICLNLCHIVALKDFKHALRDFDDVIKSGVV